MGTHTSTPISSPGGMSRRHFLTASAAGLVAGAIATGTLTGTALAADLPHPLREMPPSAQIALMHEAMTRYALGRLVVHTAWASSYMGRAPLAPAERTTVERALALGNMAAGFRYAHGYDGGLSELRCAAHAWTPVPEGMDCAAATEGRSDMVIIPAWHIPHGMQSPMRATLRFWSWNAAGSCTPAS